VRLLSAKYIENISLIAFIIIIPFFLFYNTLITLGIVPPFLGGYFGIVVSIFLLPLMVLSGVTTSNAPDHVKYFEFSIYIFCIYITAISLWNFANGANSDIIKGHFASIIYFLVFLNIFKNLNFESIILKVFCLFTALLYFFYLAFYVSSGLFVTNLNTEHEFSYQFIGLAILVIGIILLANIEHWFLLSLVILIISISLFLNGARTELICFILFFIVNGIVKTKNRMILSLFYFVVLILGGGALWYFKENFSDNRFIALFEHGVSSGSGFERVKMADNGFNNIDSAPILGNYGEYRPGEYMHNIFSLWSDFGLFPFILLLTIYLSVLIIAIKKILCGSVNRDSEAFYISCAFSLLPLMIFAKTFEYILIPICFGVFIRTQIQTHLKKS
jgi:hypothetical protein